MSSGIYPANNINDPTVKPFSINTPNLLQNMSANGAGLNLLPSGQSQSHSTPLGIGQVSSFEAQ